MLYLRKVIKFQGIIRENCKKQIKTHIKKIRSLVKLQAFARKKIAQNKLDSLKKEKSLTILFK